MNIRLTPIALSIAMAVAATGLQAAENSLSLEEVVVTAQKRDQSLQDVPISVAVETAASIEKKGLVTLKDLASHTPNLYMDDVSATANISMRGLASPGIESIEPSVGLYIDGISMARPRGITQNPFYDLERIEVLRGPQGTLWGRNTIAGAINIITAKPTEEFEGHVNLEFGNYNAHVAEAVVSGPLTETLSGRFSVYDAKRGGYLNNKGIGPDGGGIDSESYRLHLDWHPSDDFNALLKLEKTNHAVLGHTLQLVDPGPDANYGYETAARALGENFKTDLNQVVNGTGPLFGDISNNPRQANTSELASLTLNWNVNGYELSSQTGYVDYSTQRVMEFSGGPINIIALLAVGGDQSGGTVEFKSQEFRIASPKDGQFSWIAGIYADELEVIQTPLGEGGGAYIDAGGLILIARNGDTENVDSTSAYFEGQYEINEQWIVTAGIRYGEEDKEFKDYVGLELDFGGGPSGVYIEDGGSTFFGAQTIQNLKKDGDYTTWSAKLQYFASDDAMYYASLATGYKSGGFNNGGNTLIIADKVVEEEDSISLEIGAKLTFADGRGRLNAALFRTEFEDLQVSKSDETTGVIVTTNAAEAVSQGIELDVEYRLSEAFTIGGNVALLDAEYDKFERAPCGPVGTANGSCVGFQDLSGETLGRAPEYSASAFVEYFVPVNGSWDATAYLGATWRDEALTNIHGEGYSDKLNLVNARLQFVNEAEGWTVAIKGSNLTDSRALLMRQDNSLLQGAQFGGITMPRTYALQVKKQF